MPRPNPRRGTMALGAGLALGIGAAVIAGQLTGTANAESPRTAGFTLSVQQLAINQAISSAAVRRSNESLRLLDPLRPRPNQPNRILGWRSGDLRDNAVTSPKIAKAAVTEAKVADNAITRPKLDPELREAQPRWAVVNGANGEIVRATGAVREGSARTGEGRYTVRFDRNVSECSVQASVSAVGTAEPPSGTVTTWRDGADSQAVRVKTTGQATGNDQDLPFHVTVLC
jgi:hypothetical protein